MSLTAQFKKYLESQKLSEVSIRNYLADVRRFLRWAKENSSLVGIKSPSLDFSKGKPSQILDFRRAKNCSQLFQSYRQHLIDTDTPQKTANRYLCSLRHFGQFLQENGLTKENPAKDLENYQISGISYQQIISDFEKALLKEKLTAVTIKNYLADTRQFLEWLENYQTKS